MPDQEDLVHDFSKWSREALEQFAQEAAEANRRLKRDLRIALDAYHLAVTQAQDTIPSKPDKQHAYERGYPAE